MLKSKTELIQAIAQGRSFKYLFFWGHTPSQGGSVTASCFSQWWEGSPFVVDDVTYLTAEHYMMAEKARLFGDRQTAEQILQATHPKQAKDLGRKAKGFDEKLWNEQRLAIVTKGNLHKFSQHPELQGFLSGTGNRVLVEASPVDAIWGIGLDRHAKDAANPVNWPGLNLLGFALMQVRELVLQSTDVDVSPCKSDG
jgi:ribA/ribD-fused uncharacterized protein